MKKLLAGIISFVISTSSISLIPASAGKGAPIGIPGDGWALDRKKTLATRTLIGKVEDAPVFGDNSSDGIAWKKLFTATTARVTIQGDYFGEEGWDASGSIVITGHALGWGQCDWHIGKTISPENNECINKIYFDGINKYTIEINVKNLIDSETTNCDISNESGLYTAEKQYTEGLGQDYADFVVQSFNDDITKSWNIIGFELINANDCSVFKEGDVAMGENVLPHIISDNNFTYYAYNNEASIKEYIGKNNDVIIPSYCQGHKVTSIESDAFRYNSQIKSLTIPDTITKIQHSTLSNCINLKDIYYDGFKDEWNKITNGYLSNNITIHFKEHIHDYDSKVIQYSTCTSEGMKEFDCKYCYNTYVENIPKLPHSYIGEITMEPTCTSTGEKTYTCLACGDKYTTTIEKTPHKYLNYWIVNEQATCTENGSMSHMCIVCGDRKDITIIPALNHQYAKEITKEATCISDGITTSTCTICGDIEVETTDKTEHKFSSWTTTEKATCKATGTLTRKCSLCGKTETKTIPKTSHSYKKVTIASTYFEKGYTANKCSKCGAISNKKYTSLKTMSAPKTSSNSTSSIKLSWGKVSGAKGYVVYQKKSGKWSRIKVTASNSYTVSKLKSGTTYQFCVKPYTKSGTKTIYGNASKTLTTSTNPATVSFKLTAGTKKVSVKWSKVTGASGYKVYYKTSKNGSWKTLKTCNNKTTSYTKTKLTKGKTYYFTVKAYRKLNGKTYNGSYTTKSIKSK